MTQDDIDKQWPGFTVTCDKCASTMVELRNTQGWSQLSGNFGEVTLTCLNCGNTVDIAG